MRAAFRPSGRRRLVIACAGITASVLCAGSALALAGHVAQRQRAQSQSQTGFPDPTPAPATLPGGVRVYQDVSYAYPAGYRPLALDLYLPPPNVTPGGQPSPSQNADGTSASQRPNVPVVVYLHGGDWISGSRKSGPGYVSVFGQGEQSAVRLARLGYAVASVDYRLAAEARWPAPLHDAKAAVRWLRANAATYHLDPNRVGAWGVSSGGQLASLLGLTGDMPSLEGDEGEPGVSSKVRAVASWAGASDLLAIDSQAMPGARPANDPNSSFAMLLGCPPTRCPDLARQASPQTYVRAGGPPFLLAHGLADREVPYEQSVAFEHALAAVGVPVKLDPAERADANFNGASPRQHDDMYNDLRAFLDTYLASPR